MFLATGLCMRAGFPELYGANEALRYIYRANHAYILLAPNASPERPFTVLGVFLALLGVLGQLPNYRVVRSRI